MSDSGLPHIHRRRLLTVAGAAIFASHTGLGKAAAQAPASTVTSQFTAARAAILAGREARSGRVTLDVPRLAESGNSVSLEVTVAGPMTPADRVTTLHILAEQNPVAIIARFRFGPRSGPARIATNIRVATTQNIHAIAEMNDGSVWTASSEVVVLIAACLDGA
jgi:sulfur-oxidizing protein SoxY